MVFSSKAGSWYTRMFLTHVDEQGNDSPPVLIPNSTAANRAVNIPEFVNIRPGELESITMPAINHLRFMLKADELFVKGRYPEAIAELRRALDVATDDVKFQAQTLVNLGGLVSNPDSAMAYLKRAIAMDPEYASAYVNLAVAHEKKGQTGEAVRTYKKAIQVDPKNHKAMVRLARILMFSRDPGIRNPAEAVSLTETANNQTSLGNITVIRVLAQAYSETGRFSDAVTTAAKALVLARERGMEQLEAALEKEMETYRENKAYSSLIYKKM